MIHGKAIWKPGISEMAKQGEGGGAGGGGYTTPYEPQCADAWWVMEYGHKTQSFMKNGVQQKCLDKALLVMLFYYQHVFF